MPKKMTFSEFVKQATATHGDKYRYVEESFTKAGAKTKIICPSHGEFMQNAFSHISGHACMACMREADRLSFDGFLRLATARHGNKYTYDPSGYVSSRSIISITCPIHGIYSQTPATHLVTGGCQRCATERTRQKNAYTTDEYIARATEIHCGKYDYAKTVYTGSLDSLTVTCPIHGDFIICAANHMRGKGCKLCSYESLSASRKFTLTQFIEKAMAIHGNRYDYSASVYINSMSKIDIVCPDHGTFSQVANAHLIGEGCPVCNESHGESIIARYLEDNGYNFVREKRFPDCRNKRPLPFDFFLPDERTIIEFHGEQHYKPVRHWGGYDGLDYRSKNDDIKARYALDRGYAFIIVPPSVDDIPSFLDSHFGKLKHQLALL